MTKIHNRKGTSIKSHIVLGLLSFILFTTELSFVFVGGTYNRVNKYCTNESK